MEFSYAEVTVNPMPVAPEIIIADRDSLSITEKVSITLTVEGGSGDEVIWTSIGCDGDFVGDGNPLEILRPGETTTYFAKWENSCGQSKCNNVLIVIDQQYQIYAPTAFTPDGDGMNDEFKLISPTDLFSFKLIIFNRWGQQVFESNDLYHGWDGTYKGAEPQVGTFVWKATYQLRREGIGSEANVQTGSVSLVR